MAGETGITRREVLRAVGGALLSLPLVAVSGLWMRQDVSAQQKMPKEQAKYQNAPKDGQQCSGCRHFVPANACKLVQGEISPQGWCMLYTPKQPQ